MPADALEIPTPQGAARAHLHPVPAPVAALVLGHGAGGGVSAPDLLAAAEGAAALDVTVALVDQPYRVAGRRSPPPAPRLDEAWTAVLAQLRDAALGDLPLVTGGRSSGARVACRTARATGALGVLCLAFPLQPPGRASAPSRQGELDAAGVPVLVVQGERDPFGMPESAGDRVVVRVPGTHRLTARAAVAAAVHDWLERLLA